MLRLLLSLRPRPRGVHLGDAWSLRCQPVGVGTRLRDRVHSRPTGGGWVGLSPGASHGSAWQRAGASVGAFSGRGLRAQPGELRGCPVASPCTPLDERLSCSQLCAHSSSPGAVAPGPQQQHESGQMDRGHSTRGAKKGGPGWGRAGRPPLPTDTQSKEYVSSCGISFPSLPLPSWYWLVQILVEAWREG